MANVNTDNLSTNELNDFNIDSPDNNTPDTADDFFEALDRKVNQGILEPEEEPALMQSEAEPETSEMSPEAVEQEHNWEKRYSDSSREAKRLNGKLAEIEPYMPILDAMREDPNLISHVRSYFEGGGQTPQSMNEKLNLNEDFVFDPDEAFSQPDSDSAKVLGATIDGVVQRRLSNVLQTQKTENAKMAKEAQFKQKMEMSDDEWKNFTEFAKSKSLELEDIYYLMNRKNRDKKIADSTRQEIHNKMREVQQQPGTLATQGSTPVERSNEDSVFDTILGSGSELEKAFSI